METSTYIEIFGGIAGVGIVCLIAYLYARSRRK
jgi:hypothetical protein